MKKIITITTIFSFLLLGLKDTIAQENINYIVEKVYTEGTTVPTTGINDKSISVSYFDGLGRPIQSVQVGASPNGKDLIQHIAYDDLGRESKKFLPYVSNYAGGFYRDNAAAEQEAFYASSTVPENIADDNNPWADIVFEESPLNRVLEQGAPGTAWQTNRSDADHAVHFAYQTNAFEVKLFEVDLSNNLLVNGIYTSATLYKTGTRDENEIWSYEYKDLLGQVVMKVTEPTGLNLQTYYVYDDFGLLRYVVPPKAVKEIGTQSTGQVDQNIINNLCYYYEYDGRKRMSMKKLPGAEAVYMVYDKRDRLVLTQDGNLRADEYGNLLNKWMFTKYDVLNRPFLTGIYYNADSVGQAAMQNLVTAEMSTVFTETYNGSINNHGYSNDAFPQNNIDEILTVTYYDNYAFDKNPIGSFDNVREYAESINNDDYKVSDINYAVKGLVTGTLTKVLGTTDHYLLSVNLYDDKYRVIRTYQENYLGGDDVQLTKYDFIGNVLKTKQIHVKESGSTPVIINQQFEYDHANRLKQVYHQIEGNGDPVLIAEFGYNEIGQVIKKKLNENVDGSFLQEVDYEYNIRGWLTKINDPIELQKTGEPKDMFAMQLHYNDVLPTVNNTGDEQYNGNIAAIKWNTPEFGVKAYGYGYDNTNRIERAKFAAGTALNADVNKYSVDSITYDANGNILTLGRHNTATSYIDKLTMTYDGNRLKKADDGGDLVLGFVDIVDEETEYHYDFNGNMDIDENKGFAFAYNYLNLPKEIVGGNDTVRYIYDATGAKISKELVQGGAISYTDYVGNFVYKDGDLDYISTDEGRITQPTAGTFQYEYFLKDHLGNTRTVFADGNGDGVLADNEVLQETHYYPFGMSIGDLAIDRGADNKYKFGGKELQDDQLNGISLALYDFHARFYDPANPTFLSIDPKAEERYFLSPYNYCSLNPINRIDPDGMLDDEWNVNIETDEVEKVSDLGGDKVQFVNFVDNEGKVIDQTNVKGSEAFVYKLQDGYAVTNYDSELPDNYNENSDYEYTTKDFSTRAKIIKGKDNPIKTALQSGENNGLAEPVNADEYWNLHGHTLGNMILMDFYVRTADGLLSAGDLKMQKTNKSFSLKTSTLKSTIKIQPRAPKGGVTINGKFYKGGQFIPRGN